MGVTQQQERIDTYLGKIDSVWFGLGGRNGATMGLTVSFRYGMGFGSATFIPTIDGDDLADIETLLKQAKCKNVNHLLNKPVQVTLVDDRLKEWRILEEVL